MEEFRVIYRLLKAVAAYERAEEKSLLWFEPDRLRTTVRERDRLAVKLLRAGYIAGLNVLDDIDNQMAPVVLWNASRPEITLAGMEYLEENSLMRRAAALAREIRQILP